MLFRESPADGGGLGVLTGCGPLYRSAWVLNTKEGFDVMRAGRKVYIQAWQRYPAFNARARQGMVLPPVAPKKAIVGFKLAIAVCLDKLRVCM